MQRLVALSGIVLISAIRCLSSVAAEPVPPEQLAVVMEAWRSGDLNGAQAHLTDMIESGTLDARVYYYRALVSEQLGRDIDADLKAAAKLEAETSSTRAVNRALENVQGPTRAKIEKFRVAARAKLKSDPAAEARKAVFREGMEARSLGDLPMALEKFDAALADGGTDPRTFYLRGVVLAEMGRTDDAKLAFADGLANETTSADVRLVNLALAGVQGGIRRLIEEETTAEVDGTIVTRQQLARIIRRLDSMTQEERLAEADAAEASKAERTLAAAEARKKQAADAIIAQNKAKTDMEAKLSKPDTTTDLLAAADTPKKSEPAAVVPSTPIAEAPVSSNPFLGGKAPAVGANSIDMSYLPADTDFLTYARPADLLASDFIKPLRGMPEFEGAISQVAAMAGFEIADIDSVTSGMSNSIAGMTQAMLLASSGASPSVTMPNVFNPENSLSVVRTNKEIDFASFIALGKGVEATHEGKTYYLMESPTPDQQKLAVYPVDSKTFVVGVEERIQSAISDGPGEATNDQFSFVSGKSELVVAFSSPLLPGMSGGIPEPPGAAPPFVGALVKAVKGKIAGAAITINLGSNLDLKIVVNLTEPSAADDAQGPLDQAIGMAKQAYPQAGAMFVPKPLQVLVGQVVNSLAAAHRDTIATIAVKIPGEIVSILKDDPTIFQGMIPMGPGGPPGQPGSPGPPGPPAPVPGFGPQN